MKRPACFLVTVIAAILAHMGGTAQSSAILPEDLIAYWMLNGDLTDSAPAIKGLVGPGSDGTFKTPATPTFVAGQDGLALDLTAVGTNYVRTQTFLDGGPKTVVLWANSTFGGNAFWAGNERGSSSQTNRLFFGQNSSLAPWLGAGATNNSTGSFSGTAPNDGTWHMYVLTDTGNLGGTGGTVRLYQDNLAAPIKTMNYTGSTASPAATPFVIGQAGGATAYYANAILDDVAVFNRMLLPSEMAAIHSFGSVSAYMAATPQMPKFSWLFDGNAKAQLGGIDGTLATTTSGGPLPTFSSTAPDPPLSYSGNQYIQFDSTQQYVNLGNAPELQITDAITVSLWMKTDVTPTSGDTRFLVGKYGLSGGVGQRSWSIGTYNDTGLLRLMLSGTGEWTSSVGKDYRSTVKVTDDEWHHVAFTFSSDGTRLYLDGDELTTGNGLTKSWDGAFSELHNSTLNLNVARRSDNSGRYEGLIDELAIWNSVLSPDEIKWLYHSSIYAIPEPSTFAMLLFAIAALAWPRRGKSR